MYANKEALYCNQLVISADSDLNPIETRDIRAGSFFINWTDAAAANAVVKLQCCADPSAATPIWHDVTSMTTTISAATGKAQWRLAEIDAPYYRIDIAKNSETTAKLTVRYYLKGE